MKRLLGLFALIFCCMTLCQGVLAETWYVRLDGGNRYSANVPLGQCDGQADAAYPGTGVNQHCAFGDYRYLWDDQSYGGYANWAIAGGDTVIVDNTKQWRVGFDTNDGSNEHWCFGGSGPYSCSNPPIPPGTSAQHTRFLGRNYATCNAGNAPDLTKMTQIFGGHGVGAAIDLTGAQYVDIECIELTRHSQCITEGSPAYPSVCNRSYPLDDYASDGMHENTGTHDVLLQDMWIHGFPNTAIKGPIGGLMTSNRVLISTNGDSGWEFDDGTGSNNGYGTANLPGSTFVMHYSTIEFSGCNQEYPAVDTLAVIACYSQSTGGYGDGIGTPPLNQLNVVVDHSTFRYNTQDGEDFGHIDTGSNSLSITDSQSYGNSGGQFKWGTAYTSAIFENNLVLGDCLRMSEPLAGAPATYNANLQDFCRAGSTLAFNVTAGTTAFIANNTFVGYSPVLWNFLCAGNDSRCSNATITVTNNIFRGYDNPATYGLGGQAGGPTVYCGPSCSSPGGGQSYPPIGTINRYHNSYYGIRIGCPAGVATESISSTIIGETCNDALFDGEPPSFVNEATFDGYDFALSSGSPAIDAGIVVAGLTTDYLGTARSVPPSLGAIEYVPTNAVVPTLSFGAISGQTFGAAPFAVSATSASPGTVTYSVTSGPATISGSMVTLTGAGTVVLAASQAASGNYFAATASISFSVAAAIPNLSFTSIANQTFGSPAFSVDATSASNGTVTYSVTSGPATISGAVLTLSGAGTVVLHASQAATANYTAATASVSFTVGPALPTLSFAAIGSQTYGAAPFTVSATSASTGAVTYAMVTGPATIIGNILTVTGVGNVEIMATQAANTNYVSATATVSFIVLPESPTLGFANIENQTFGNAPFNVSATSASGGAVTYSVVSGPATVAGSTVSLAGAGMVVLSAIQAAAGNYAAATTTARFVIAPAAPALSFTPVANQIYGAAPFVVSAASPSSGALIYTVVSGSATIAGSTITSTGVGTVVLGVTQAATTNYAAATATISFTVSPGTPTLQFAAISNQTYGSAPVNITATSASTGAVTYRVVSGPATIAGNTVSLTGAGMVVLSASQAAAVNYTSATASTSFIVAPEAPTLIFTVIANQTFGNPPLLVSATSVSAGAVTYTVVSGSATIAGGVAVITGAGTVTLSATQAASGNYATATATISFTVAPAVPTLSFAAIANQTFGSGPLTVSASSPSLGAITYTLVSGPATISGNIVTLTGLGPVVLGATQAANGNYAAAATTTSFTVAPEIPSLSFTTIADQVFGAVPVILSTSSPSAGAITYTVVSGPAAVSGNSVTLLGVGTVVLSASQTASGNYAAATATTSFNVLVAAPSLTFVPIAIQSYGAPPFSVSAASSSTGAVTYTVISGPATLSGNTVSLTGAGMVTLSASQAASGNYSAVTTTTSFTVLPGMPTLNFAVIPDQSLGTAPFTISATSISPGPVTYAVVSGPATISGNTVTLTDSGVVVLSAAQAATANYMAATAVATFTVEAPPFTLSTTGSSGSTDTATAGAAAAFSLVIAPDSGRTMPDAVKFSATGLPTGATATFSPATIAAGSQATNITLTIQTAAQTALRTIVVPTGSGGARCPQHKGCGVYVFANREGSGGTANSKSWRGAALAFGVFLLPGIGCTATRRRLLRVSSISFMFALAMLSLSVTGMSGCSGSSADSTQPPPVSRQAKTYNVVATATDEITGWQNTTNVTLIVN